MTSCDLLYIRAIKYYKLPMISPEIATYFKLCAIFPPALPFLVTQIFKWRQRTGHSKVPSVFGETS